LGLDLGPKGTQAIPFFNKLNLFRKGLRKEGLRKVVTFNLNSKNFKPKIYLLPKLLLLFLPILGKKAWVFYLGIRRFPLNFFIIGQG